MQQLPCTLFHSNAVMIAIHSAVYNFLTPKVAVAASSQTLNDSGKRREALVEPDNVYYRFGGAAIADMLHNHYKKIHTCSMKRRSDVVSEISVVKAMQCTDKINRLYHHHCSIETGVSCTFPHKPFIKQLTSVFSSMPIKMV